jgi:hypothetical protein
MRAGREYGGSANESRGSGDHGLAQESFNIDSKQLGGKRYENKSSNVC